MQVFSRRVLLSGVLLAPFARALGALKSPALVARLRVKPPIRVTQEYADNAMVIPDSDGGFLVPKEFLEAIIRGDIDLT